VAVCAAASSSCDGGELPMQASPAHASMFGEVDVTISGDFASLGTIHEVRIGGVRALDLRPAPGAITVRIQGAPEPGPAVIEVAGDGGTVHDGAAFAFDPPVGGAPEKWFAFGASLTHGVQSAGLNQHGQLAGYAADVARAAGVFLGPPLVVDGVLPPMSPSLFVADCNTKFDPGMMVSSLLAAVTDPTTQETDLTRARQDPTLVPRNPSVGGSKVSDVITGLVGPEHILERIVELPDGDPTLMWAPTTHTQLDRIRELDPDVAFSADLLANDVMSAIMTTDGDLHPELATDPSVLASELDQLVSAVGALHGQYFIGNLLDVTLLPAIDDMRQQRIAAGLDTEASFDAKVSAIQATVAAYNAALTQSASGFPNVHVVDLVTPSQDILANGVTVSGVHLTGAKFGGLLSLDHLHFSDTGYAVLANLVIDAIDATLGLQVPEVDLASVLAADPFSPASLAADGIHCP
jgi:lysophospholipase L1-like esterase